MADALDAFRKILAIDLPNLPAWAKGGVSIVLLTLTVLLLLALWRSPTTLAALDPATAHRLERGIDAFFENQGEFASSRAVVFGEAKAIVRRMKAEPDVFPKVQMDIEARKRNDNNWTFANQLNEALALVNALGLAPDTPHENSIFLQLPLPIISGRTDTTSR